MVNDTIVLLDALNLPDNTTIWGLSMGGIVSTAIATFHKNRVGPIAVLSGSAGSLESDPPTGLQCPPSRPATPPQISCSG